MNWWRIVIWFIPLGLLSLEGNPNISDSTPSRAQSYFHFIAGSLLSLTGNAEEAYQHYSAAYSADPQAKMLALKQAEELFNLGKADEAKIILDEIENAENSSPEFHVLRARLAAHNSDLKQSLKGMDQAIHLFLATDNTTKAREMVLTKVALLADNRDYPGAVSAIEKYLKSQPDDEISLYFLGKIHTIFQNRGAAKKAFSKALELRPNFMAASKALGLQHELDGNLDAALAVYQRALRTNGGDEELIQKLINLSLIHDDYVNALEYLKQFLIIRPDDYQNQMRAALIHYKLKQYHESEEILISLIDSEGHEKDQDRIRFYLASLNDELERFEDSIQHFSKVSSESEYYVEARLQIAQIYQLRKAAPEEAIRSLEKASNSREDSPELTLALAAMYEQHGQINEAVRLLTRAVEKFQENEKIFFLLGSVLDRVGDFEGSIRAMRRVLTFNANNAHALNHIGYSYAERGINLEEAESLLKRATQLAPENGFIVDSLAWTYFQMGKHKKAQQLLERADKLSPDQPVILEHLADTYQKLGMPHRALEVYKKIMRISVAANKNNGNKPSREESETHLVQERVRGKLALLEPNSPN